jgi:hypothetical protein
MSLVQRACLLAPLRDAVLAMLHCFLCCTQVRYDDDDEDAPIL